MQRTELIEYLRARPQLLKKMDLMGPAGQIDHKKAEKLEEVAGFSAVILRYVRKFLGDRDELTILECSCGKSYLGFALAVLLPQLGGKSVRLRGVDHGPDLIERCRSLAQVLGLEDYRFTCSRILRFRSEEDFDAVVALHACDTATDEAIARGIQLGAPLVLAVPCCQNQIRGQLKSGHPLTPITDFGPARYRLANLLTDTLRAQFLRAAGYHVKLDEIGSPKLTPKNLCICARKVKSRSGRPRDREYRKLRDLFGVRPRIEKFCPEVTEGWEEG